jgi:hypothetical protein
MTVFESPHKEILLRKAAATNPINHHARNAETYRRVQVDESVQSQKNVKLTYVGGFQVPIFSIVWKIPKTRRGIGRIELPTSRTRSENPTSRPNTLLLQVLRWKTEAEDGNFIIETQRCKRRTELPALPEGIHYQKILAHIPRKYTAAQKSSFVTKFAHPSPQCVGNSLQVLKGTSTSLRTYIWSLMAWRTLSYSDSLLWICSRSNNLKDLKHLGLAATSNNRIFQVYSSTPISLLIL